MSVGGWNTKILIKPNEVNKTAKSPVDEIIAMLTLTEEERYNWQEFVIAYKSGLLSIR